MAVVVGGELSLAVRVERAQKRERDIRSKREEELGAAAEQN